MPAFVYVVDFFSFITVLTGFIMTFRQDFARRILGRPVRPHSELGRMSSGDDPLTYGLRIAGTMLMAFGLAIGGMVTLFNLA